jgi:putative oxidoreductase
MVTIRAALPKGLVDNDTAALLLLIDISVAILTTKVPLVLHKGFWPAEAEARADYSMFMSTLLLLIVGQGPYRSAPGG